MQAAFSTDKSQYDSPNDVNITYTVTNTTQEPVYVSAFYNPLEGVANKRVVEIVDVKTNERRQYTGVMRKRLPPGPNNFVLVEPGRSVSKTFSVTSFAMLQSGRRYRVEIGERNTSLVLRSDPNNEATERTYPVNTVPCEFST